MKLAALAVVIILTGVASQASAQAATASPAPAELVTVSWPEVVDRSATGQRVFRRLAEREREWVLKLDEEEKRLASQVQRGTNDTGGSGNREQILRRARTNLERMRQDAQRDITDLGQQVAAEFQALVAPVIESLVRERGIRLVLERERTGFLLWNSPAVDISALLVERLDAQKF